MKFGKKKMLHFSLYQAAHDVIFKGKHRRLKERPNKDIVKLFKVQVIALKDCKTFLFFTRLTRLYSSFFLGRLSAR